MLMTKPSPENKPSTDTTHLTPQIEVTKIDFESVQVDTSKNTEFATINSNMIDKPLANAILLEIYREVAQRSSPVDPSDLVIAVCMLLQKGGTSRQMNANSYYKYATAQVYRHDLSTVLGGKFKKVTARQFARAMAQKIAETALELNIPGNQSKNYQLDFPDATDEDLCWASDFQTFNPNCPEHVRSWLLKNFQKRFRS